MSEIATYTHACSVSHCFISQQDVIAVADTNNEENQQMMEQCGNKFNNNRMSLPLFEIYIAITTFEACVMKVFADNDGYDDVPFSRSSWAE